MPDLITYSREKEERAMTKNFFSLPLLMPKLQTLGSFRVDPCCGHVG
jgi:hypothetical protein